MEPGEGDNAGFLLQRPPYRRINYASIIRVPHHVCSASAAAAERPCRRHGYRPDSANKRSERKERPLADERGERRGRKSGERN